MIVQNRRVKIVSGWIKDSPEFKSLVEQKKALQETLTSCCFKALSREEKLYYDTYGPKYVLKQLPFCVNDYLSFKEKGFQKENLCCGSMWVSSSEFRVIFEGIPELSNVDRVEIDPTCPFLMYPSSIDSIKKIPKEIDSEIYKATKAYYDAVKSLDRKIKALVNVVFSKEASLREIKRVFPKLYEYSL